MAHNFLWIEGFEDYSSVESSVAPFNSFRMDGELSNVKFASAYRVSFVPGRFGGRALSTYVNTHLQQGALKVLGTDVNALTFGFAVKPDDSSGNYGLWLLREGGTSKVLLHYDSSGRLIFRRGAAYTSPLIAQTGVAVITANQWVYIEVEYLLHPSQGSIKVFVNNELILDEQNLNTGTGPINVTGPWIGYATYLYDDIYVHDGLEALGDSVVESLYTSSFEPGNTFTDCNVTRVEVTGGQQSSQQVGRLFKGVSPRKGCQIVGITIFDTQSDNSGQMVAQNGAHHIGNYGTFAGLATGAGVFSISATEGHALSFGEFYDIPWAFYSSSGNSGRAIHSEAVCIFTDTDIATDNSLLYSSGFQNVASFPMPEVNAADDDMVIVLFATCIRTQAVDLGPGWDTVSEFAPTSLREALNGYYATKIVPAGQSFTPDVVWSGTGNKNSLFYVAFKARFWSKDNIVYSENTPDGDSSYYYSDGNPAEQSQIVNLTPLKSNPAAVHAVQVSSVAKKDATQAYTVCAVPHREGQDAPGQDSIVTIEYHEHSNAYGNNPFTLQPWTPADVYNLQVKVTAKNHG